MRTRSQYGRQVAAISWAVVLLLAGTARLFHTSFYAPHTHERAVSEAASFIADHLPEAAASLTYSPPALEARGPSPSPEMFMESRSGPLLRRWLGRAPPAWF